MINISWKNQIKIQKKRLRGEPGPAGRFRVFSPRAGFLIFWLFFDFFIILENLYFRCFGLGFGYFWGRIRILREKLPSFIGSNHNFMKFWFLDPLEPPWGPQGPKGPPGALGEPMGVQKSKNHEIMIWTYETKWLFTQNSNLASEIAET